MRKSIVVNVHKVIRRFASSHGTENIHKEEFLKVAREWPHEYFDPSHYEKGEAKEQIVTPEMISLMATSHEEPEPQSFNSVFWTRVLMVGVAVTAFYRMNEYLTKDGKIHPLTEFIGGYLSQFDGQLTYSEEKESIPKRQQYAYDHLILNDRMNELPKMKRWSFPDTFSRASDFLIPVGSQIDVSDVKMKHSWEEED